MSLVKLCHTQLKDNYWNGTFEEYDLIIDKDTGYFNATKLCESHKISFDDWLSKSKELIAQVEKESSSKLPSIYTIFENSLISGYYLRKELLLSILQWISLDYSYNIYKFNNEHFMNKVKVKNGYLILTLIKKNQPSSYPYCCMRTQRSTHKKYLRKMKSKFPQFECICEVRYYPNSFNLLGRIKEEFKNVDVRYNQIKLLNGYTEEEFIKDIIILAKSK